MVVDAPGVPGVDLTVASSAVDKCPGPFMTSAETVCFSCTAGSSQEREVAVCPGQLATGTMEGYLQSGSLLTRVQDRMCP